jgi:hypothetical protein
MPETDKYCFVIGPIGGEGSPERNHADWLLQGIIHPEFEKDFPDWKVERADKITAPGMVSSQIITRLHDVALVIADLSFHNPNAFYEMSLRHTVGKPIIHMIRKNDNIPFDVIPHRAILFSLAHPDHLKEAQNHLRDSVVEAIAPGFKPDNPIMHARGRLEFEQNATPEMKVLSDELATLRARLERVETLATAQFEQQLYANALLFDQGRTGPARMPWLTFSPPGPTAPAGPTSAIKPSF